MKYHELSEDAKEKARDDMRERLEFWSESVIDDWTSVLRKLGFCDAAILWTGFWSQGDGACFVADWSVDWMKLDEVPGYCSDERAKEILAYPEKVRGLYKLTGAAAFEDEDGDGNELGSPIVVGASLRHRDRYYHENSIDFNLNVGAPYPTDEAAEEFKEWCRGLMRMIYQDLEADYEWQMSDEYIEETIEANEYDFNEEGEME